MVIYNSGTVRFNIIVAQLIGAVAFHLTMGRYVAKVSELIATFIGKISSWISYPLIFIIRKIVVKLSWIKEKIKLERKSIPKEQTKKKKIMNILKIHMKN
jgi:hypothetical protein